MSFFILAAAWLTHFNSLEALVWREILLIPHVAQAIKYCVEISGLLHGKSKKPCKLPKLNVCASNVLLSSRFWAMIVFNFLKFCSSTSILLLAWAVIIYYLDHLEYNIQERSSGLNKSSHRQGRGKSLRRPSATSWSAV